MDLKNVTAVILSGGASTRMGVNKSLLKIGELTIIETILNKLKKLFKNVVIITNQEDDYMMLQDVTFYRDCVETSDKNALVGIYTGLINAKTDYIFVVACDMPLLNLSLIEHMILQMENEDIGIPYFDGYFQPLYAIYKKSCIPFIENQLNSKNYKIIDFYDKMKIRKFTHDDIIVFDRNLTSFLNINTKESYSEFLEMINEMEKS